MASMREIKRRRSSVQSTQQITKAMKLISTVKLQKSKNPRGKFKSIFRMHVCDGDFHACKSRKH